MHPRRRNTVHDLAALRIHRDGTRVLNSDRNLSSRRAKYGVRDARGNWIAQDAGGLGTVKQRYSASRNEAYDDSDDEDMEAVERSPSRKDKGKDRARESGNEEFEEEVEVEVALGQRAQKRKRFDEDFSYLDAETSRSSFPPSVQSHSPPGAAEKLPGVLPVPSSDLLKCLHYFATTYYTTMGQLYDATRETRKQRKIRRGQKLKNAEAAGSSRPQSETLSVNESRRCSSEVAVGSDEEEAEADEDREGEDDADGPAKAGCKKKRRRLLRPMSKDMYKILDGSALMALGMLLQEHIAETLEPNIPAGWEKEMAQVKQVQKAEARKIRGAERMRNKRHPVKLEPQDEIQDAQEEDEMDIDTDDEEDPRHLEEAGHLELDSSSDSEY